MHFHIVTSVWGDKFVRSFLEITLANLLSPKNLPAMSQFGNILYRIFTNSEGREWILNDPIYDQISKFCEIEILVPFGSDKLEVQWHVNWFHRAAAEAKLADACVVFVPPDTLWANGSFTTIAERLTNGAIGIACPFVQVTENTLVPALKAFRAGSAIDIDLQEMVVLALTHIHPLQILGMPDAPHARPAFEMHWPINRSKMISRYAVRELVAFDPNQCPITYLWYAGGGVNVDKELYFGSGLDDLLMLSVDPVNKYFQNYIIDHHLSSIDVARTTLHPLNDTQHTRKFIRQNVGLGFRSDDDSARSRKRQILRARSGALEIESGRRALQLIDKLEEHDCKWLAKLLAVAVFETPLLRRWRQKEPLTLIAFRDAAWASEDTTYFDDLMKTGNEIKLYQFIKKFVVPEVLMVVDEYEVLLPGGLAKFCKGNKSELTLFGHEVKQTVSIEGTTLCIFNRYT